MVDPALKMELSFQGYQKDSPILKDFVDGAPIWTSHGASGGLDPLAMLAPIEQVYSNLLTGMSSVTVRFRYYSFLAWWVLQYARGKPTKSQTDLSEHIRKGEALVGLATRAIGKGGGLAGENTFGNTLRTSGPEIDMVALRQTYLKTPAFFAVYGGQMTEMGILARNKDRNLAPTPDLGIRLANAYEEAIGADTAVLFQSLAQQDFVRQDALPDLEPMCINFADPYGRTREQELLRDMFMGRVGLGARRNTLLEIMLDAHASGATPDEWGLRLRWLSKLPTNDDPHHTERMRWAHFQVADSLRVAMEALLRHSVIILRETGAITLNELIVEVCGNIPRDITFSEYLTQLAIVVDGQDFAQIQRRAEIDGTSLDEKLALIAKLWVDWSDQIPEMAKVFPTRKPFTTSATEFRALHELQDRPAWDAVADFLKDRVLRRHSFVAARKLHGQSNNTFQMEYEAGRLIARQLGNVGAAGPRLATAISFLRQLGILNDDGLTHLGHIEMQRHYEV